MICSQMIQHCVYIYIIPTFLILFDGPIVYAFQACFDTDVPQNFARSRWFSLPMGSFSKNVFEMIDDKTTICLLMVYNLEALWHL